MYGTSVYDIRTQFIKSKATFRKLVFLIIFMTVVFFVLRQLVDLPSTIIQQVFAGFSPQSMSLNFDFLEVIKSNNLINAVIAFMTGIITVCMKFYEEIKALILSSK